MPTRPNKRRPATRVYETTTRPKQTHFTPRNRTVSARNVSSSAPSTRQQTLTQIDFVQRFSPADEDELALIEEDNRPRARKRRKKMPIAPSTPTVQTRAAKRRSMKEEVEQDDGAEEDCGEIPHLQDTEAALTMPPAIGMPPPNTPRTIRKTEIPSSESTATPLSTLSRRSMRSIPRSPLKERSTNTGVIRKLQPGVGKRRDFVPKLEIRDTFDNESEGSELSTQARYTSIRPLDPTGFPLQFAELSQRGYSGSGIMLGVSQDQNEKPSIYHGTPTIKAEIEDSVDGDEEEDPEDGEDIEFSVGNETQAALVHAGIFSDNLSIEDGLLDEPTYSLKEDESHFLMPKAIDFGSKSTPVTDESDQLLEENHNDLCRERAQSVSLSWKESNSSHQPYNPVSNPITPSKSRSYSLEASAQLSNELQHLTQPQNHRLGLETESQFENAFHDYSPPNLVSSSDDERASAHSDGYDSYHTASSELLLPPPPPPQLPVHSSQATTADLTQTPFVATTPSFVQPFHFSSSPLSSSENGHGSQYSAVWDGKPLTDSQLLPDSLMRDSVHPVPMWEEDGEETWGMEGM